MQITVNRQELDTILAALRLLQAERDSVDMQENQPEILAIAEEHGKALNNKQINSFCERINAESATPYVLVTVDGGVADIAENASNVSVDILDFDNLRAGSELSDNEEDALAGLSDREKEYIKKIGFKLPKLD